MQGSTGQAVKEKNKKIKKQAAEEPNFLSPLACWFASAPSLHCGAGGHVRSFCLLLLYDPTGMPFGSFLFNSSEWGGFNEF